jgi:hypothetical protein
VICWFLLCPSCIFLAGGYQPKFVEGNFIPLKNTAWCFSFRYRAPEVLLQSSSYTAAIGEF